MQKKIISAILFIFLGLAGEAQLCTAPGQTPESAIFICGAVSMTVTPPSVCGNISLPIACADGYPYINKTPVFFKILCFTSGTLGFTINSSDPNANVNWVLYDVTSTNPADVYTNSNLAIAYNFSSDIGETGASRDGTSLMVCSGMQPLFSSMPDIVRGRTYILMVVNESGSLPFDLAVGSGSASITDPTIPEFLQAGLDCLGTRIGIRMNKLVDCSTISGDGSDFTLSAGANIIGARSGYCNNIFGSDSVYLQLDQPLSYGRYLLTLRTGNDGNTIGDICKTFMPVGDTVGFTVSPLQPTFMDSIKPSGCLPGYIELVFKKPMQCSSVAADGSDFLITGPQLLTVVPSGCNGNKSVIRLAFTSANVMPGDYQLHLQTGSDGNTLLDECGMMTPAATLSFNVKEYVSAAFTYNIPPSCGKAKVEFSHDGARNVNSWNWNFGGGITSSQQNPVISFANPGTHLVKLTVSNGICTDTSSASVVTNDMLRILFTAPSIVCPGDTIHFENKSTGNIDTWTWDFGNRTSSTQKDPAVIRYAGTGYDALYTVTLSAHNNTLDCDGRFTRVIKVLSNCLIRVPTAFSPNGDGKNDLLYPLNAIKADELHFRVYNRLGQLVFSTNDWTRKWDGTLKGMPLPAGVYAWLLEYKDPSSKERVFLKGTTMLIR